MSILAALLGSKMAGQYGSPASPSIEPDVEEIPVDVKSRMRDLGPLFGLLQTGSKWGNIVGGLGDALLVGTGKQAMYNPRLQQARRSEALQGFDSEPLDAIARLRQVDDKEGQDLWNDYTTRTRQNRETDARIDMYDDKRDDVTEMRVLQMLGGTDAKSYPAMRERALKYAKDRGLPQLSFDLPETYDAAVITGLRGLGVPVKDQERLESQRQYREEVIAQRDRAEGGRNRRAEMSESGRNARTNLVQDRQDKRQGKAIEARGSGRRPRIKFDPATRSFK